MDRSMFAANAVGTADTAESRRTMAKAEGDMTVAKRGTLPGWTVRSAEAAMDRQARRRRR